MKRIYGTFIILLLLAFSLKAQVVVTGTVTDGEGHALEGVEFYLTDAFIHQVAISDSAGIVISEALEEGIRQLSYIYSDDRVYCGRVDVEEGTFALAIGPGDRGLNLGQSIGTSEKLSTQSTATIGREELLRSSEVNIGKALYGQLPGLYVMQSSDINMFSSPDLYIRGRNTFGNNRPLVLVDGFERELDYLTLAEIESVTVLKDALASTLYGVRGGNGVISVTTQRGNIGKPDVTARYKYNMYRPFRQPEMADALSYANALNEALANDGLPARYSGTELAAFQSGNYPYAYPDVNWADEVFNDYSSTHQLDLTARGGRQRFRYFAAAAYVNEMGLYKGLEASDREDHELSNVNLNIRSNVDVNVTNTTMFQLGLLAHINQQEEPGPAANSINTSIYDIPAAAFPVYSENNIFASNNFFARNPLAMVNFSGFDKYINQTLFFDFRLRQDLSPLVPGLSAEAAVAYDYNSMLHEGGNRDYKYDVITASVDTLGNIFTSTQSYSEDTPMDYFDNITDQFINNNIEAKLNYTRTTSQMHLNSSLIFDQSWYFTQGRNNTNVRQSVKAYGSALIQYRYMVEAVLNYSGSVKLPGGDRFHLYPAVSVAWVVSEEGFFPASEGTSLKARASYGISASDLFSHDLYRTNFRGGGSAYFANGISAQGSTREGPLPTLDLNYETVQKADLGLDLSTLDHRLGLVADLFYEYRSNILVSGDNIISGVLGLDISEQVDGIISNKGVEALLSWQEKRGDFGYRLSGNVTFARSKVIENNEGFLPYDYLSKKENSLNARYGLESVGFFASDTDIQGSPIQVFSTVSPGDIKYKDQNGDDIIDELDYVKISDYDGIPEIYYGFNVHLNYKGIGMYALFQGVANRSIYTNTRNIFIPLQNNTNISNYYLEQKIRWTPSTSSQADVPRLTTQDNDNNFRLSDLWIENGSYFKLRNIELYYILPSFGIDFEGRIFVRGANLFSMDHLKYFDPENYGIGYPSLSSYTAGVQITF